MKTEKPNNVWTSEKAPSSLNSRNNAMWKDSEGILKYNKNIL